MLVSRFSIHRDLGRQASLKSTVLPFIASESPHDVKIVERSPLSETVRTEQSRHAGALVSAMVDGTTRYRTS